MKCRKCGRVVPYTDKFCVYCGSPLVPRLRIPVWGKWLIALLPVCVVAVMVFRFFPQLSSYPDIPAHVPILTWEPTDTVATRLIVNSKYISAAPVIDGVLAPDEWMEPAFVKPIKYSVSGEEKSGTMKGYFLNDSDSFYGLITVSAEDFKDVIFEKERVSFSLLVYFDDDDDVHSTGRNIITFWTSNYADAHISSSDGALIRDDQQNGEGTRGYEIETNTYLYEFRIPLNSGDSDDLAMKAGDTLAIKVVLQQYDHQHNKLIGVSGWPSGGTIDASAYGRLALAAGPAPATQPILAPTPTPTPTPPTMPTSSPALLWKLSTGEPVDYAPPSRVALSTDGLLIATGSGEKDICLLDQKGNLQWRFSTGDTVNNVAMSADGSVIAASSQDGNIYLLDRKGTLIWRYFDGDDDLSMAINADGSFVAVGSYDDDTIYLLDRNGKLLWEYTVDYRVWAVDLSTDGSNVVAGDYWGNIYLFDQKGNLIWSNYITGSWVEDVVMSADGSVIAAVLYNGNIFLFDRQGNQIWKNDLRGSNMCVAMSTDGSYLAVGSDDDVVYLLDKSGILLTDYSIDGSANGVALSNDGSFIAASSMGGYVYLFTHSTQPPN